METETAGKPRTRINVFGKQVKCHHAYATSSVFEEALGNKVSKKTQSILNKESRCFNYLKGQFHVNACLRATAPKLLMLIILSSNPQIKS